MADRASLAIDINIDGRLYRVDSKWCAREIKHHCGINQAKELALILSTGLEDIADDEAPDYTKSFRGVRFMTHARRGGSS